MQCKFCQVFYPAEVFINHVKTCTKDNRTGRSHFFQIPMSLSIQATQTLMDEKDHREYTEYII